MNENLKSKETIKKILTYVGIILLLITLVKCTKKDDNECKMCRGSGYYEKKYCPACNGTGESDYNPDDYNIYKKY